MKNLNLFLKKILLLSLFLFSLTSTIHAVELANDQFTNNIEGYSNGYHYYGGGNGWMILDRDVKSNKTYNFGSTYANTTVTISYGLYANDKWDDSDRFKVKVNGNDEASYQIKNGGYIVRSITVQTDSNGKIKLEFKPDTNNDNEFGGVNYVVITTPDTPTVWVKNAAGTSAYTDPTPYGDNVDITETLTSPTNSTNIEVTVSGNTESNFDFVYITDSAGNTQQYDGSISDTYSATGPSVTIRFTSDGSVQATNGGVTVSITDVNIVAQANPDSYTTALNTQLVVTDANGVLNNDSGTGITITGVNLAGLQGNIDSYSTTTGAFTFTPATGFTGTTTFTYTITDTVGNTSTATVTITVAVNTDYSTNLGFSLINPPATRNIIGGYAIAGNTVLCLTDLTSGYATSESQCLDTTSPGTRTSNNYVAKYIDIDANNSTWNASSSNITLPASYDQQGGNGILWAGLIWQGRFVWDGTRQNLHYHLENGSNFTTIETGSDVSNPPAVTTTSANVRNIRLKVDNGNYDQVTAYKVYSQADSESFTYTAIADATSFLRTANLAQGKHTFTIANLPTEEGRENTPGIYGGWSLVVIYAEDPLVGKPRNVSIYGGMDHLLGSNDNNNVPIQISGFKLPSSGNTVTARLSIFAGEGEEPYGPDGVSISDNPNTGFVNMPTASSPTNIFDAVMNDIDRDTISGHKNNLQNNNVGIDVDNFTLDSIVSGYDRNITSLYLKWYSDGDYIIPGMIAFSTELYQPNICYDYTLDIGGYVIPSVDNIIETPYGSYGDKTMTTRVSIKSLEGDFDLQDVNITYHIGNINHLAYITDSTAIAPNGIFNYIPAGTTGLDQTYDQTNAGFGMYIGAGASKQPDGPGGIISSYETRYFRFVDDMKISDINTNFSLTLQYSVDYGSGPLTLSKILQGSDLCQGTGVYSPAPGIFNTTSTYTDVTTGKPYNLFTQISKRDFDVRVFSYDPTDISFSTVQESNGTIEVEVFNAGFFARDVNLSCFNPDSNISAPQFVSFRYNNQNHTYADVSGLNFDFAIRNAGFRTWHLTDPNTQLVYHNCTSRADESCFRDVYTKYYVSQDQNCTTECSSTGSGCYTCLRTYYGRPICSRDNFSIRPEAFVVEASDSNQSTVATHAKLSFAHSASPSTLPNNLTNQANIVSGYNYRFDVNATSHADDLAVKGYIQSFNGSSANSQSSLRWSPRTGHDVSNCNDVNDTDIGIVLFNGTNVYNNLAQTGNVNQIGQYQFEIYDANWTAVDWDPTLTTHHTANGFALETDCTYTGYNNTVANQQRQGCYISTSHTNIFTGVTYNNLDLEFFPYSFNVAGLNANAPLGGQAVYINTLDSTLFKNGIDENMSYNIQGSFYAVDWSSTPGNGQQVTNFVNNCFAYDTDMNLKYSYLSQIPTDTPLLRRDIIDYNTTNTSIITRAREENLTSTSNPLVINTPQIVLVGGNPMKQSAQHFTKDMKGAITMDLGLNFDRTFNTVLNPRYINFSDLNLTLTSSPNLTVDGVADYQVSGDLPIDQNITFTYAKAKANKAFYDDVITGNIQTPVSIVAYCDLGLVACQNRGLDVLTPGLLTNAQSNEANWWYSQIHSSAINADGIVTLTASGGGTVTPADPTSINITAGSDNSVLVTNTGATPNVVNIDFGPDTDRWLIYNPDFNVIPSPFYRVRFIGTSGWTGYGKTGHVVGDDISQKKSRRVE